MHVSAQNIKVVHAKLQCTSDKKTVMDIQYLFPLSIIKLTKLYQLVSRKIRDPSAPDTRNQK